MSEKGPNARTRALTPNQVVSLNLAQARKFRGWTQQDAIDALEPHMGVRMSTASYSAMERFGQGGRLREFDADDLVAFSKAFRLPVPWFFLPPKEIADVSDIVVVADRELSPADYMTLIFGDEDSLDAFESDLAERLDAIEGGEPVTDWLSRAERADMAARYRKVFGDPVKTFDEMEAHIRKLAKAIRSLEKPD